MLERMVIEDGISSSLTQLWEFELSVYVAQAQAAHKAIQGGDSLEITKEARAKIMRLARNAKSKTREALKRDITKLVQDDLDAQMDLYQRAYQTGIARTSPVVPVAVTAANARAVIGIRKFVDAAIDRIARPASALIREEGIKLTQPSGRNVHDVYAYVRQNITSAMIYNSAEQQREVYDSMDIPEDKKGVETSSHWGARPEHAEWQGKVFDTWKEFVEATKYGEITGICGINCRHLFYPFIPGLSKQRNFPKPEKENDRRYKVRQTQKRMESEARKLAAEDEINKALGRPEQHKARIKLLRSRVRALKAADEQLARDYAEAA